MHRTRSGRVDVRRRESGECLLVSTEVSVRAARNRNEVFENKETVGRRRGLSEVLYYRVRVSSYGTFKTYVGR